MYRNNFDFHQTQMMGLVNSLKTGDPTIDMVLAMLLPYIISRLVNDMATYFKKLLQTRQQVEKKRYQRAIVYDSSEQQYNSTNQNAYLIRAILRYTSKQCSLDLPTAELSLATVVESNTAQRQSRHQQSNTNSTVSTLETSELIEKPVVGVFLDVGMYAGKAVSLKLLDSSRDSNEDSKAEPGVVVKPKRVEIHLRSDSREAIKSFVKAAQDFYVRELKETENNDRFMFDYVPTLNNTRYQKFKLGDEKTFDNLFSRSSKELLSIVDKFQLKQGKYAIKGYPHKLGLLLSGPPGTGKTSLIKAISQYTKRHIVNIPLGRVSTNAQFMNAFFNKAYYDTDNNIALANVDFKDVIFVLEDVDAASDVVFKRADLDSKSARTSDKATMDPENRIKNELKKFKTSLKSPDELDLSGILNVLDGVVETPGRIVIMTSNCPGKLDPALVRPGRIDRHMVMGYMELQDLVDMLQHYFPDQNVTESQQTSLRSCLEKTGVTPAQVEQIVAEKESIEEVLVELEASASIDSGSCSETVISLESEQSDKNKTLSEEELQMIDKYRKMKTLSGMSLSQVEEKMVEEEKAYLIPYVRIMAEELNMPCPRGHKTKDYTTKHNGHNCDICQVRVAKDSVMSRCHTCNWDACEVCTDKIRLGEKPVSVFIGNNGDY